MAFRLSRDSALPLAGSLRCGQWNRWSSGISMPQALPVLTMLDGRDMRADPSPDGLIHGIIGMIDAHEAESASFPAIRHDHIQVVDNSQRVTVNACGLNMDQ